MPQLCLINKVRIVGILTNNKYQDITCRVIWFVDITSEHSFRACEALASPSAKMILARASLDASASAARERSKLLGMMISNLANTLPELLVNYIGGVILQAHSRNPSSPTSGDPG